MSHVSVEQLLRDGISATKEGDKQTARNNFIQAVRLDPNNEFVWLWMALVVSSREKARYCLQRVLYLNPENPHAKQALERLLRQPSATKKASSATVASISKSKPQSTVNGNGSQAAPLQPATPAPIEQIQPTPQLFAEESESFGFDPEPLIVESQQLIVEQPPSPPVAITTKTVLIVDDSMTVRRLVTMTLEKAGYAVMEAADGMAALVKISEERPDLILLDVNMPRMDGYHVCRVLKGNDDTRKIPIVMLSGNDGIFDKVKGRLAGASRYMTKPFEPAFLLSTVRENIATR